MATRWAVVPLDNEARDNLEKRIWGSKFNFNNFSGAKLKHVTRFNVFQKYLHLKLSIAFKFLGGENIHRECTIHSELQFEFTTR